MDLNGETSPDHVYGLDNVAIHAGVNPAKALTATPVVIPARRLAARVEFHLVFEHALTDGPPCEAATKIKASVGEPLRPDDRVNSHLAPKSAEHHAERWEERWIVRKS